MIALSVVKKDAEMLYIGLSWRFSPKRGFGGLKRASDPGNLSTELSRRFHMCDPCTKFEEDRTIRKSDVQFTVDYALRLHAE